MHETTETIGLPSFKIKISKKEMEEFRLQNRSWFIKLLDWLNK